MESSVYIQYLKEVKSYKLLTSEEEISLAIKIKNGDMLALKTLINSNLRLVIKIARNYITPKANFMDVIQEGNIGLITAARKFSPKFNVRFASYASLWIKQAINRYITTSESSIHLPIRKATIVKNAKKFINEFTKENKRKPVIAEIVQTLGLTEKQINQLLPYIYEQIDSLDAFFEAKDNICLYNYIQADERESPEDQLIKKEIKNKLNEQLDILSPRDKDIIKNRYCLNNRKRPLPFHVLAQKYSISAESVRQIEIRAIKKLNANKETIMRAVPV